MAETTIITGGLGSIGRETANRFIDQGHKVYVLDIDKAAEAEDNAKWLEENESQVQFVACDFSDPDFVDSLPDFGPIRNLVCVAGVYPEKPIAELSHDDIAPVFAINVFSVFKLMSALGKQIVEGGSIVFVGSMAGSRGSKNHSVYSATKGALMTLAKSAALEFGPRGVRVNNLAPGVLDNPMTRDFLANGKEDIQKMIPANRFGQPEDMANAIEYLCSDRASYVTGHTLHVNGGMYM